MAQDQNGEQEAFPPFVEHPLFRFFDGGFGAPVVLAYTLFFATMCVAINIAAIGILGKPMGFTRGVMIGASLLTGVYIYLCLQHTETGWRSVPEWLGKRFRMGQIGSDVHTSGVGEGWTFHPLPVPFLTFQSVDVRTFVLTVTGNSNTKDRVRDVGIPVTQPIRISDPHLYLGIVDPKAELDEIIRASIRPAILGRTAEELYDAKREELAAEIHTSVRNNLERGIGKLWGLSTEGVAKISGAIVLPKEVEELLQRTVTERLQRAAEESNIAARAAQVASLVAQGISPDTALAAIQAEAGIKGGVAANVVSTSGKGGSGGPGVSLIAPIGGNDPHHHHGGNNS